MKKKDTYNIYLSTVFLLLICVNDQFRYVCIYVYISLMTISSSLWMVNGRCFYFIWMKSHWILSRIFVNFLFDDPTHTHVEIQLDHFHTLFLSFFLSLYLCVCAYISMWVGVCLSSCIYVHNCCVYIINNIHKPLSFMDMQAQKHSHKTYKHTHTHSIHSTLFFPSLFLSL